jgi:hypothetical protein
VPWRSISNLAALQQLLKSGPADRSAAAALFREVLQVVRCVLATLDSPSPEMQRFAESVLRIAESKCGVNRVVSKDCLVQKCKEVEQVLGHVVVDSSDPPPAESNAQLILDHLQKNSKGSASGKLHREAWDKINIAGLEAFFSYASGRPELKLAMSWQGSLLNVPHCCRQYEESTIAGIFNRAALADDVRDKLRDSRLSLLKAVQSFYEELDPNLGYSYVNVVDRNTSLRFFPQAGCMSLYSTKMKSAMLEKANAQFDPESTMLLVPFDEDIGDSKARSKCFLTLLMQAAQVNSRCFPIHAK